MGWLNKYSGTTTTDTTVPNILINAKKSKTEDKKGLGFSDEELLKQAWKESSFRPGVKNSLGYMGLAQVGDEAIHDYKKAHNLKTFDPYDPTSAKKIQRWYMDKAYNSGLVTNPTQTEENRKLKALAYYNYGPGNLRKVLKEAKSKNIDTYKSDKWLDLLPKETREYGNKILGKDEKFNKEYDSVRALPKYNKIVETYVPKAQDGRKERFSKIDPSKIYTPEEQKQLLREKKIKEKTALLENNLAEAQNRKAFNQSNETARLETLRDNFHEAQNHPLWYLPGSISPFGAVEDIAINGLAKGFKYLKGLKTVKNPLKPKAPIAKPELLNYKPEQKLYYDEDVPKTIKRAIMDQKVGNSPGSIAIKKEADEIREALSNGERWKFPNGEKRLKDLQNEYVKRADLEYSLSMIPVKDKSGVYTDIFKKELDQFANSADMNFSSKNRRFRSNTGGESLDYSVDHLNRFYNTDSFNSNITRFDDFKNADEATNALNTELDEHLSKQFFNSFEPPSRIDYGDVLTSNSFIDRNFMTKPLTPFTKNELTKGEHLYRKIGNKKGLQDLIDKKGAQAPGTMRMNSGEYLDTPFFGVGKTPNENYSGMFAVETPKPSVSKYDWSNRVGGTNNYGVAPINRNNGTVMNNIPLEDLQVYRKKWFSNNYKKLDKTNLEAGMRGAGFQNAAEKTWKWGTRGFVADQIFNDGDYTGGLIIRKAKNKNNQPSQLKNGGKVKKKWLDKYQHGGKVIEDNRGQWAHPGKVTKINSNNITMKGVNYPVLGVSDTGDTQMMYPNGEYQYDGKNVTEYPMAQDGKIIKLNEVSLKGKSSKKKTTKEYKKYLESVKKYNDSLYAFDKQNELNAQYLSNYETVPESNYSGLDLDMRALYEQAKESVNNHLSTKEKRDKTKNATKKAISKEIVKANRTRNTNPQTQVRSPYGDRDRFRNRTNVLHSGNIPSTNKDANYKTPLDVIFSDDTKDLPQQEHNVTLGGIKTTTPYKTFERAWKPADLFLDKDKTKFYERQGYSYQEVVDDEIKPIGSMDYFQTIPIDSSVAQNIDPSSYDYDANQMLEVSLPYYKKPTTPIPPFTGDMFEDVDIREFNSPSRKKIQPLGLNSKGLRTSQLNPESKFAGLKPEIAYWDVVEEVNQNFGGNKRTKKVYRQDEIDRIKRKQAADENSFTGKNNRISIKPRITGWLEKYNK